MILEKVYDELMAQIEDLKKAVTGGGSGTKNYNELDNRPYINSKLLTGNKNSKQIGVAEYITAEDYADLESPSEHEIYFVSDRPEVAAWGFTKSTAQIHWTEGDNTYTATVSAAIGAEGEFYKSIISAAVDDETVSIESSALEHSPVNAVVMTISCDEPEAITASSLQFMFSFEAETGQRQIIHNGMRYGTKFDVLEYTEHSSAGDTSYELAHPITDYDLIMFQHHYTGGGGNGWNAAGTFPVEALMKDRTGYNMTIWVDGGNNDRAMQIQFVDTTHYKITNAGSSNSLCGVYGIKF